MATPSITISVTDGALGIIPNGNDAAVALIGVSSTGTTNTVYTYEGASSIDTLRTDLGNGSVVEQAALLLSTSPAPVYVVTMPKTTAATNSAVTLVGSSPTVTLSGAPYDDYDGKVLIVLGGATATMTFKYSLDGGETYSEVLTSAATYAIPNSNITLNFAAGTYVAGDYYTWESYDGQASTANIAIAMQTLADSASADFAMLHVVGNGAGAADSNRCTSGAAIAVAVDAKAETLASSSFVYLACFCDSAKVARTSVGGAALITAYTATLVRTGYSGGEVRILSPISNRFYYRPAMWAIVSRLRQIPISEHAGRVRSGPLSAAFKSPTHDQRVSSALDTARFATLRTFPKKGVAVYVTRARMGTGNTSDFQRAERRRVIDRACAVAYEKMLDFLNDRVRVQPLSAGLLAGRILEGEAAAIENEGTKALRTALTENGHCSSAELVLDRTINILAGNAQKYKVRVTPLACVETMVVEVAFFNPVV